MMRNVLAALAMALLAMAGGLRPAGAEPRADAASPNDTARFLAGLPPAAGSPLEALTKEPYWQSYAKNFETEWNALDAKQLGKARAFSAQNIGKVRKTVLYFFSGPDFLYADAFFPGADTYVLSGLEPVGKIPDITSLPKPAVQTVLGNLRASLSDVLSRSYFITSHMDQKLRQGQLAGVLPVLYVFMARTGKTIEDVSFLALQPDGTLTPFEAATPPKPPKAVKISFKSRDGKPQTLYFFSTNVANKGVADSGFLKFTETLGQGDALIKSASYLPHGNDFSSVREAIMKQARILQDDTGPPIKLYAADQWKLTPFGVYVNPIPQFHYAFQPQAKDLFEKAKPEKLEFSYGYRYRQSGVVIAERTK